MTQKILIAYGRLRVADLATFCKALIIALTGNLFFPTPNISFTDFEALIDQLEAAIIAARTGDKNEIAKRNALRKLLVAKTKKLAQYVNSEAEGNLEALITSGFKLAKVPQPSILATPVNLKLVQGNQPGSVGMSFPKPNGASAYEYMYAPNPLTKDSVWTITASKVIKHVFEGLEQGQTYWFKVKAIGSKGQVSYSDAVDFSVVKRGVINE